MCENLQKKNFCILGRNPSEHNWWKFGKFLKHLEKINIITIADSDLIHSGGNNYLYFLLCLYDNFNSK